MKLRNKVLITVTLVWAVFASIIYIGSNIFLTNSFLDLERDRASRDLARIDQALDQNLYSLYTFTADWAHWNDLYDFMQGKNPQFIANNFTMAAYVNSTINLLTYWDANDKLIVGVAIDTAKRKLTAFPAGIEKYIYSGSAILDRKNNNQDMRGFISLPDGIMMIAAAAITDGQKLKAPIGTMVTGRYLSADILKKIEDVTKLRLELFTSQQIAQNPQLETSFEEVSDTSGHYSSPINDKTLLGYTVIKDINHKPIGMLRMTVPRAIFQTGSKSIHYFLTAILLLGILFVFLMDWLLRRLVIKRLENLDRHVEEISANGELKRQVDESGTDELSSLSAQINKMLTIIQSSQEKLEYRVEERTRQLQKTNIQLQQEISERKSIQDELIKHKEYLARIAHYDVLTALPNRVLFNEMLNTKLRQAKNEQQRIAIFFMDLDRFKTINDALGHHIGDIVLKEISLRILNVIGKQNVLARLGGDEFILLIAKDTHADNLNDYAQQILTACSKQIKVDSHDFYISTSIGISVFPDDGESLEDLQRNADMAMYKSKRAGGGNYQYYSKDMDIEAHERIRLDAELRRALDNNEFILFYQPKINISTGQLSGVEALIRWKHPEMGLINPSSFIPFAEQSGLILQLGEWVLNEACQACQSWQDQGHKPITVAVNISPKQFAQQNIVEMVTHALTKSGLAPAYLELEITESAVMENMDKAAKKLNAVREMGVKVAIDDFGTGYTSISYLKHFPVTYLKIDQAFVKGIPENQNDVAIIVAMIALAHSLNMRVIAEGVETADQFQWLADNGCDIVQGYFLSRPLPEAKLKAELMAEHHRNQNAIV